MATKAPMEILRSHQAELRQAGVKSLKLFGSVVRGEAGPESDIDILVEFSRPIGLLAFVGLNCWAGPWTSLPPRPLNPVA